MAVLKRKKMNLSKVTQKAKEGGKTSGISYISTPAKTYKFHLKKNRLSIIPFEVSVSHNLDGVEPGELWYKASVLVHSQVGVNKQMVVCPKMFNHRCPICDAEAELAEQGYDWNSKERGALRAKKRELYNVIDMDKPEDGMQILETSHFIFGKMLDAEIEDDESNAAFADPDDGSLVVARGKEETFGSRKYVSIDKISFEERDPLTDEELEKAVDLHAVLKVLSYEELENLFNGEEEEAPKPKKQRHVEEDEDEEEETPKRRRHVDEDEEEEEEPKPRRRHVEEEEDEDEEEEEEPKPRRKSLKKKKSDEDDDFPWNDDDAASSPKAEESDDEDDEEEEDADGECSHFGECGYDDDKCDECDNWSTCRKETDRRLKAKRSK